MVYGDAILKKVSSDRAISTYSFLNGTELLKLLSEGAFLSVPCKAAVGKLVSKSLFDTVDVDNAPAQRRGGTHPIKSLDMMMVE